MIVFAAVLGLITGSFLNALSFRLNTGRGMGGRSRCMHCGHTLLARDLVPVLSFAATRGHCRYCRSRISLQYPTVELAAAALAVFIFLKHPEPLLFAFWFVVWMTLLFVVLYDLRHKIIPWQASLFLGALGLGYAIFNFQFSIFNLVAGPVLASPLLFISLVSRGRSMGWGDGGLMLGLGWLLGLSAGFTALMVAFWSGAIVGIILMLLRRGVTMKSELPFAPFLVLGAAAAHFFYADFLQALQLFL